jgi:DNA-binding MarR family transcriptional regulator
MAKAEAKRIDRQTESPSREAFHALLRVSSLLDTVMQTYFGRFGISRSQWAVLRNLHRAEEEGLPGLRPADLSNRLLVRPPSVTGLIDRLERLGYVFRNEHADDLRGREVRLSASGRRIVERILPGHPTQIASVMSGLKTSEQKQFHKLLQRLGSHLESMIEGRGDVGELTLEAGSSLSQ